MTDADSYKIAKWLMRHGDTKRKDIPQQIPHDLYGDYKYFHVYHSSTDAEGYPIVSGDNVYAMSDSEMDTFLTERRRRKYEIRNWVGAAAAVVAALAAAATFFFK